MTRLILVPLLPLVLAALFVALVPTQVFALGASCVLLAGGAAFALLASRSLRQRERVERALADEATKFRTLIEALPDALVIHRDGQVAYVNDAAQRLLALPLVAGDGTATTAREVIVGAAPEVGARPVELRGTDGAVVRIELRVFSLGLDGAPATIALARDVTERRRLQERLALSDRMASLGTLAAGVAHEINNPLTYILSNLDFVAAELAALAPRTPEGAAAAGAAPVVPTDVPPIPIAAAGLAEIQVAIDDARAGAGRVQHIVLDMKKLARGEATDHVEVDVRRPLESAARMLQQQLRPHAALRLELAPVPTVSGSESQLMQVFMNLLSNAAEALDPSAALERRTITIRTRAVGRHVEVEVRDTGVGMAPAVRERIFDAFFTTKPVGVGTGLGLSISHTIVTALGGTLSCESALGEGTTMRVQLPVAVRAASRPIPPIGRLESAGARILVVDDDLTVAESAARILGGHQVSIETSPARALARLEDGGDRFDLVLCDVGMPAMSGLELYAALSRSRPEQTRALAFMSGADADAAALVATGAPILPKPFDREQLHAFVASQMARLAGAR